VVVPDNLGDPKVTAFDAALTKLVIDMKHQILEVLQLFLSFMHGFDKKRGHNMLALMLNLGLKSIWLVVNYCDREPTSMLLRSMMLVCFCPC
jgi:hypothetical protein